MAHTRAADDFQAIRARMSGGRGRYGNRLGISRAGAAEKQRHIRQSSPIVKAYRPLPSGARWMILGKLGSLDLYLRGELGDDL